VAKQVVVIGAGQAAASFAAKLREIEPETAITIIGDEPVAPYQRPPLSKKYMTGEMSAERLLLRPDEWYAQNNIRLITGHQVQSIDRKRRMIMLAGGETHSCDKLLIATGSTPRRLPETIGGNLAGVHVLRNLADADRLGAGFKPGKKLLVVGGGYIGLETAAVAVKAGLEVTVVEMAERILQRVAAPQTSDYFRAVHQANGVVILEGKALSRLVGGPGGVSGAEFANGSTLAADIVLVGIGVAPNDGLAKQAGLAIDNGITVDAATRTSDPDIFAAGDCASFEFRGRRIRLESVQNAIEQGEAAARAIAGQAVNYRPVPWFWSDQYDVKLQIAGLNMGYDRTVVRPGAREGSLSVWYFSEGSLIAVDAMNDPRTYMIGKRLLEQGRNLSPAEAADPAFDLKARMG
jgi:3-phenylpropionate/trans-cinnamate dioxygenase ferredoxin reductase subunit